MEISFGICSSADSARIRVSKGLTFDRTHRVFLPLSNLQMYEDKKGFIILSQNRFRGIDDLLSIRRRRSERSAHRQIASERMVILLDLAVKSLPTDHQRAQHYVVHARKLGMRYKVRIPVQFRKVICRHCKQLIVPGVNARVRISQRREPHVVISCIPCGGYNRIPLRMRCQNVYKKDASEA